MTALAGVELETLDSEPDALTTRPPPLLPGEVQKNSEVATRKTSH